MLLYKAGFFEKLFIILIKHDSITESMAEYEAEQEAEKEDVHEYVKGKAMNIGEEA